MATTISFSPEFRIAGSLPAVQILEANACPARVRLLEDRLRKWNAAGARVFNLSCHFSEGGPWAGVNTLFSEIYPEIRSQRPDLIERHSRELVGILPRLRRSLTIREPSLTDLAPPEERTRSYPADRALRIVNGLIDLLDEWKSLISRETPWVIACDCFDEAGAMGAKFFAELMRRRGERLHIRLLVAVSPEKGKQVSDSLAAGIAVEIESAGLTREPAAVFDPEVAAQMAANLERRIGDDRVEMQIHLSDLIRLWSLAGRPDKLLHCRLFGLETYNILGLYQDALRYGEGLLDLAGEQAPKDERLHWSILVKLLICHIGQQDVQTSIRLAEEEGMKLAEGSPTWRAHLFYMVATFYARYRKPPDLVTGEEYLRRAAEALEEADLTDAVYHYRSVFNRGLAMIRNLQGRFPEAIELCRKGITELRMHPNADELGLQRSVLIYNIAQVYFATGSFDEAIQNYSAAIAMDPNYSEYYNERGNIFLQMNRLNDARADYLRAIELSPPYFEVFANLGQCYRRMGAWAEAIENYSRAIDLQPDHLLALLGRAKAHEELGHREEAIADYTVALARDPTQWEAIASRGVVYYETGDLDASLQDFDRAVELKPDHPDLYHNRATVLADLGRYRQAEEDIEAALKLNPADEDRMALQARLENMRQAEIAATSLGSS